MKKVLLSLVVVTGALLFFPFFISDSVKLKHQSFLDHFEKNSSSFTLKNSAFEQHWFGATAKNTLVIPLVDAAVPNIELTIVEDISFGPLLFSSSGITLGYARSIVTIEVNEDFVNPEVAQIIKDNVAIQVIYTLSQNVIANIEVQKIEARLDNEQVIIEPLTASYAFVDGKHISANLHWLGAKLSDNKVIFTLGEMRLDSEQTLIDGIAYNSNALFKGKFTTQLSQLNVVDKLGVPLYSMKELSLLAESKVDKDLMTVNFGYHVDELISGKQAYNNANFSMELNNLKIDILQQVIVLFNDAQTHSLQLISPEYSSRFLALLDKLLVHEPVFKLSDFSVETASGKIAANLNLSIDKVTFDPSNTSSLITALKLDAKGHAPTEFFQQLDLTPFVDMYVQQGYLLKSEEDVNFTVNLSEGVLEVNGNPTPL